MKNLIVYGFPQLFVLGPLGVWSWRNIKIRREHPNGRIAWMACIDDTFLAHGYTPQDALDNLCHRTY